MKTIDKQIIRKQRELLKFYADRISANSIFLWISGIRETDENIRKGERLRSELDELNIKAKQKRT